MAFTEECLSVACMQTTSQTSPRAPETPVQRSQIECWYFLYGECKFGSRCVNLHTPVSQQGSDRPAAWQINSGETRWPQPRHAPSHGKRIAAPGLNRCTSNQSSCASTSPTPSSPVRLASSVVAGIWHSMDKSDTTHSMIEHRITSAFDYPDSNEQEMEFLAEGDDDQLWQFIGSDLRTFL